jgi:hypothetical protein
MYISLMFLFNVQPLLSAIFFSASHCMQALDPETTYVMGGFIGKIHLATRIVLSTKIPVPCCIRYYLCSEVYSLLPESCTVLPVTSMHAACSPLSALLCLLSSACSPLPALCCMPFPAFSLFPFYDACCLFSAICFIVPALHCNLLPAPCLMFLVACCPLIIASFWLPAACSVA